MASNQDMFHRSVHNFIEKITISEILAEALKCRVFEKDCTFSSENTQLESISLLLSLAHFDIFNCDKKEVFQMI